MGFMHPSQFSSLAGPGVCESLWRLCVRDSPPFIPTCRYRKSIRAAYFYGCRCAYLNSFRASFWTSDRLRIESTGFWVVCRKRAEPRESWRLARPILPWASGPSLGLAGCCFRACHGAIESRVNHHQPQPSFIGCHPLMGFTCDSERTCRRKRS
jgi:hypothetical protein